MYLASNMMNLYLYSCSTDFISRMRYSNWEQQAFFIMFTKDIIKSPEYICLSVDMSDSKMTLIVLHRCSPHKCSPQININSWKIPLKFLRWFRSGLWISIYRLWRITSKLHDIFHHWQMEPLVDVRNLWLLVTFTGWSMCYVTTAKCTTATSSPEKRYKHFKLIRQTGYAGCCIIAHVRISLWEPRAN